MKKVFLLAGSLLTIFILTTSAGGNGDGAELPDTTLEGYSRISNESLSFDLQWKVDGELLHVQMTALTTGWVAVGFDPTNMMLNANILIGYVSNGNAVLSDHFGTGLTRHTPDTELGGEDNFSDVEGEEVNGTTVIRFSIPLDSGDPYDKPLEAGKTYKVVYAYGPNGKNDFSTYHARSRGSFEITL